jgi:dephospho-CoA kinase
LLTVLSMGLGGGIGAGKSAVADLLVERGAALIDADLIAREVVVPGGPAYQPVLDRFGPGVVAGDGTIDRPALAALVFTDPQALADLNALTHPVITSELLARRSALAHTSQVVVVALPLLRPSHRDQLALDQVVVVDCPTDVALDRLVHARGMDPGDARARMAAQASREERLEGADFVVDNSSSRAHLEAEVDRLWGWLQERQSAQAAQDRVVQD